jgi:hypothetical protein
MRPRERALSTHQRGSYIKVKLQPSGFEKPQISVDIPVGDISAQQLIPAGGQIFRNSNLTSRYSHRYDGGHDGPNDRPA